MVSKDNQGRPKTVTYAFEQFNKNVKIRFCVLAFICRLFTDFLEVFTCTRVALNPAKHHTK